MITLTDTIALDAAKLVLTGDGYAKMECPVARSGIQEYHAAEMGDAFQDRDPSDIIRVYRPPEVIFSDASLASYAHKPITNDHPPEQVNAENWDKYAKGHTGGEVRVDGKRVFVPMMMSDGKTIEAVRSGKREWSAGYSVSFDVASGTTPDGQSYDAIVTGQKINHIALVDKGRAGPDCRIGDNARRETPEPKDGERQMADIKMIVDGVPFNVADATAEAMVTKLISARDTAVAELNTANETIASLTKARDTLAGEKVALESKLKDAEVTPAKLQALADARAKVIADAKKIAPQVVTDGKTEAEIRKAAVVAKVGDHAATMDDAAVSGAFAVLVPVSDAAGDDIAKVINDGALNVVDAKADFEKAKAKRLAEMRGEKEAA